MTTIPFDDARWSFRSKPTHEPEITSDKLVFTNNPKTDWWRTLERDSTDGLAYGFEVELGSGIEISVELNVKHKDRVSLDRHSRVSVFELIPHSSEG